MGRIGATIAIPSFCLNRIRPHVQIRFSPIKNHAKHHGTTKNEDDDEEERRVVKGCGGGGDVDEEEEEKKKKNSGDATVKFPGRKIMILVDSSLEAKNALQWALTHSVQSQDVVVLLYVTKRSKPSSKQGQEHINEISPRISEFLSSMKNTCKLKRPEVQVEVAIAEGKEKGPAIVEEARRQGVALLVLGQKKRSTTWRLVMMWAGNRVAAGVGSGGGGVVEYCIQNATCMAIAVRRKSKKLGGYLITTKRQKDFWLLA